jgi:hypothetical protein
LKTDPAQFIIYILMVNKTAAQRNIFVTNRCCDEDALSDESNPELRSGLEILRFKKIWKQKLGFAKHKNNAAGPSNLCCKLFRWLFTI